ncbi:PIR Superfamily Protein [Plasmodium ovale wallikeri]|uniref:PIR Superfamily Protein n=1 Tax=Plasmodium ovale wallikeri TaxID=864142 RepID=A0A1A9A521_PLAOA|nr:PIR Superfamily Protein [Plasmodium ovale wallikeri]SBT54092.1 PIR Superfamily Protein [Plasmodium ovale wallikeri]
MSSQYKCMYFSRLFLNSSKELNLKFFFDAMSSESSNLSKYHEECNKIIVSNHKDKMIRNCEKFLRFLENSKIWNDANNGYDVSTLLNYWLCDEITRIYGVNNT